MTDRQENETAIKRLDWGIIVSLLMSAASLLFTGGVVYGQVQAHDTRLVKIEQREDMHDANTLSIKEDLAEIKTSLAYLKDRAQEDRDRMDKKR